MNLQINSGGFQMRLQHKWSTRHRKGDQTDLTSYLLPSDMCVFSVHPMQRDPVPDDYSRVDPEHKLIYRFVRTLFSAAQLTAECAIVTLVSLSFFFF